MLEGRLGLLRPVGGLVDNTQIVVALGQVVLICEDGGVVVGQSVAGAEACWMAASASFGRPVARYRTPRL